jgi:hypothetical protein
MCATWLLEDTILERLSQELKDMALALGPLIQPQEAMVPRETSPDIGRWPPPITPTSAFCFETSGWNARARASRASLSRSRRPSQHDPRAAVLDLAALVALVGRINTLMGSCP